MAVHQAKCLVCLSDWNALILRLVALAWVLGALIRFVLLLALHDSYDCDVAATDILVTHY